MRSKKQMLAKLIRLTSQIVHSFYERDSQAVYSALSNDFVFIGGCDYQWAHDLAEFQQLAKSEMEEPSVTISNEEFHLLCQEGCLWILYGRYTASVIRDDQATAIAHVRGTYIWKETDGNLELLHIHGSHAADFPLPSTGLGENSYELQPPSPSGEGVIDYLQNIYRLRGIPKPFVFHSEGSLHTLYPVQIRYIQAANQWCYLYTQNGKFLVRRSLASLKQIFPDFIQPHRSYLVNPAYISSMKRYILSLNTDEQIPISKTRYMEIKAQLKNEESL